MEWVSKLWIGAYGPKSNELLDSSLAANFHHSPPVTVIRLVDHNFIIIALN